ncbi:MAG: 4Fe-4S binding protein [Candidatus Aureabacteria bacterium]|nr:4Fe-4S binding protein [Candidatus Auribacterota bacterium]
MVIDEKACTGCGLCIPNCPEGALQIIDGKARLVSDLCCDGLGACIGHCPEGAIRIEEREAGAYDERVVMATIVKGGPNVIRAHLEQARAHMKERGIQIPVDHSTQGGYHRAGIDRGESRATPGDGPCGCPGARVVESAGGRRGGRDISSGDVSSELRQWPVQIRLVPPGAPFLEGADLLVAADCVPCAYGDFHGDLLRGRVLLLEVPFREVEIKISGERR